MEISLNKLLQALADLVATEPRPEALLTAAALRRPMTQPIQPSPPCDMDSDIRAAARLPGAVDAAALIPAAQPFLPWGSNPVAHLQPRGFGAIKSAATLLGPEGPILSPAFRFGLYYQRPDSYYALHDHEAAETYTILAGSALWTAGGRSSWRNAGEAIHHPARMPHAFRAGSDGLLAIWRWSGDIRPETYRLLPDPESTAP